MVDELYQRIVASCQNVSERFEIIFVEDGSPDHSWEKIQNIAQEDERLVAVRLSRNFGQHYAITAGLNLCRGDWVVVMDCDLQDRPEEIPNLLTTAKSRDYDLVFAQRKQRKDGFLRIFLSRLFYWVFSFLTDTTQDPTVANFGIYRRQVIDAVLAMGDSVRYFPAMTQWVGFRKGYLEVEHSERKAGESNYNLLKLLKLAGNIIIAFSNKPLKLTVALGALMSLTSLCVALFFFLKYLRGDIIVLGYASLILSIWFLGGMTIAQIGIVGIYVGQTFDSVKERPLYIIGDSINSHKDGYN